MTALGAGLQTIAPATRAADVTPNNNNDLPNIARYIYVGVSGDLRVAMNNGEVVIFVGLAAGVIHPMTVRRVYSAGTTATNIIALYH